MPVVSSSGSLSQLTAKAVIAFNHVAALAGGFGSYGRKLVLMGGGLGTGEMLMTAIGSPVFGGRDDTTGSPAPPSQKQVRYGIIKDIFWPVQAGQRTISVDVKHNLAAAPFPRLIVRENPPLGIQNDVVANAGAGSGWQTIGPISVSVQQGGVLEVWRENPNGQMDGAVNWDNVKVT